MQVIIQQPGQQVTGGKLTITLVEAKLTHDTETFGKMDPYVKMRVHNKYYKTNVAHGKGKSPEWNKRFEIPISNINEKIMFAVLDEDMVEDDVVGDVTTTVNNIIGRDLKEYDQWVVIYYKKKPAGSVRIKTQFAWPHLTQAI